MTYIANTKSKIKPNPLPLMIWASHRGHHARLKSWQVDRQLTVSSVEVLHV